MNVENLLKRAARTEYALLRIPLDMVDTRVVRRYFDQSSPVRQSFDRAVQTLDIAVEHWLQEPDRRSSRSYEPPSAPEGPSTTDVAPAPDAVTEPDAAPASEAPAPDATTEPDEATQPDEDAQVEILTDELLDEQETETFTGELADDDDLRHVQAELEAKRLVEEQEERRDPTEW